MPAAPEAHNRHVRHLCLTKPSFWSIGDHSAAAVIIGFGFWLCLALAAGGAGGDAFIKACMGGALHMKEEGSR